ncbi:MAG: flagellar brake protein [Chloroflexota bacterium]
MPKWKDLLSRGQTIELGIPVGQLEKAFPSVVEDLAGDTMLVAVPITRNGAVPLPRDRDIRVYFNQHRSRYCFTTRVVDQAHNDDLAVHLASPEEVHRADRRRDARIDVWMIPLEVAVPSWERKNGWVKIPAKMKNISGSGLALETEVPIQEKTPVMLVIKLSKEWDPMITWGRTVSSRLIRGLRKYRHVVAVGFTRINERDRERIQRFVFRQQLSMRKKGLL